MPSNLSKPCSDAAFRAMPPLRSARAEAALTPIFPEVEAQRAQCRPAGWVAVSDLAADVVRQAAGLPPAHGCGRSACAGESPARGPSPAPITARQAAVELHGGIQAGRHKAPTGEPASTKVRVGGEGTPPRTAVDLAPAALPAARTDQRHRASQEMELVNAQHADAHRKAAAVDIRTAIELLEAASLKAYHAGGTDGVWSTIVEARTNLRAVLRRLG